MWIFTNQGFISVVKKGPEDAFMVRARDKKHLTALFPSKKVIETRQADYRWRCIIGQTELTAFMTRLSTSIDYDNFKNSIQDHEYHSACSKVWGVMYGYQERSH
jgi:hypothetical protein